MHGWIEVNRTEVGARLGKDVALDQVVARRVERLRGFGRKIAQTYGVPVGQIQLCIKQWVRKVNVDLRVM